MNNNSTMVPLVVFGGLAVIAVLRGLYTIYKREGPLMGRGKKKFVVKGKYAVRAGTGQVIIGLSFLILVFNSYNFLSCSSFLLVLILGTFVHFAGSFRDPDFTKEFQQSQEAIKERDNDPVVAKKRRKSIVKLIVISLLLGIGMAAFMFYLSREATTELPPMEFVRYFLLATTCFSSLFFLGFLNVIIKRRDGGEW